MDLLTLIRVRSRLVGQHTGVANQILGFLLERGIAVRQGLMPLRKALPEILCSKSDAGACVIESWLDGAHVHRAFARWFQSRRSRWRWWDASNVGLLPRAQLLPLGR